MRATASVLAAAATLAACAGAGGPVSASRSDVDPAELAARCGRGYSTACRELGRAHFLGDGVEQDDRMAAALLTKACEIGDPGGCGELAVLYAVGRGLRQSDERSAALSRRACDQGFALGCSNMGALVAEGAADAGLRPEDEATGPGSRIMRYFRTACDAGAAEGCLNLGAEHESGRHVERDLAVAARHYRHACDLGQPVACYRLSLLVAEKPSLVPDVAATILARRACRGGVRPACDTAGESANVPAARAPADRLVVLRDSFALGFPGSGGFHPAELSRGKVAAPRVSLEDSTRPTPSLKLAAPPAVRARLGFDVEPRAADQGDPPVELLIALRRQQLGQCYEQARTDASQRAELFLVFAVDADGRPARSRAAAEPPDPLLEVCGIDLAATWEFPVPKSGISGPFLVRYAFEPAPPGPPPAFAGRGFLRPSARAPGCVESRLRVPEDYRGTVGSLTVKFAVDGSGTPVLYHPLTPAPDSIVTAVGEAIQRCEWAPGADSNGRNVPLWLTLPVRIEGR
jgi:TPR repeat protein